MLCVINIATLLRIPSSLIDGNPIWRKTMDRQRVTSWRTLTEDVHPLDRLNRSELEVLRQMTVNASNEEIAQRLYVSEKIVRNHVTRILEKLELAHPHDAARLARQNGLRAA